jgi:hypothetical protein
MVEGAQAGFPAFLGFVIANLEAAVCGQYSHSDCQELLLRAASDIQVSRTSSPHTWLTP